MGTLCRGASEATAVTMLSSPYWYRRTNEVKWIYLRLDQVNLAMKLISITILLGGIVLLGVFSCATVPKEPLAPGELRLLSMNPLGAGVEANSSFAINVFFEAAGNPKIIRACFYESGEEPSCFDVPDRSQFILGTKRAFQVYLPGIAVGSHTVECYAEYIGDGETRRTNVVFTQITAGVGVGFLLSPDL